MDSSKVISILKQNGWVLVSVRGDHFNFKKDGVRFIATVPHPTKDLSKRGFGFFEACYWSRA